MHTNARWTKNARTYDQVLENIYYTWAREIHHNVSLLHIHFDKYPTKLAEHRGHSGHDEFDSFLYWEREFAPSVIQDEIKEKFDESVTLEFVGRSDATLLPREYAGYTPQMSNFPVFSEDGAGISDLTGLEKLNRARRVLAILEYLNARAEEICRDLPNAWRAMIAADLEQMQCELHPVAP